MKKFAFLAVLACLGFTGCEDKSKPPVGGSGASAAKPAAGTSAAPQAGTPAPSTPKPSAAAPTGAGTGS